MIKSVRSHPSFFVFLLGFMVLGVLMAGCGSDQDRLANEIILYNWDGDIPETILEAFTEETNVRIDYQVFESQEEAIENLRAGQVYDVVVMESRFVPLLVEDKLLAKLDYKNILNFQNISANFRGLLYDPDNSYSIPYSWGTTGLVVRTDRIQVPITRWSDLWDMRYAGKIAIWRGQPRESLALTLKSLGYSANSENPAELEAALQQLIALKPNLRFLEDFDAESAAPALASNGIVVAMGYSGDLLASQELGLPVEYILPEEGALLWGDNFVIPANSPNKRTAELFINFLLRPEISAEIVNRKYYASANEAARNLIDPQIISNPAIYPGNDLIRSAEIILPLTLEGQKLYDQTWQRFLEADPKE